MTNMTPREEAAAMHGLATNPAISVDERLACALQSLAFYEKNYDKSDVQPVIQEGGVGEKTTIVLGNSIPDVWRDLVVGLAMLSKGATDSYPTHCEHDELTVLSNPHEFTRDELVKLSNLGFFVDGHAGFKDDGTDDEDEEREGTVGDCESDYCDAAFKSFRFGSA